MATQVTPEEAGQPAQARRDPVLFKNIPHLAQIDLRTRLIDLYDQFRMSLDPLGVPIATHWLRGDLTLGAEARMPTE